MPHATESDHEWKPVPTPFDVDLYDAVQTADGPYAVGASGTLVGKRDNSWQVLVEDGPAAQNSTLKAVAATEGGRRVWFVGASGAIGAYDVAEQRKYDYSYSGDVTNSWGAVAVYGTAGSETVLLANTGGAIVPGNVDGNAVEWGEPAKPGEGATVTALDFTPNGVAYATDTSGSVYRAEGTNEWAKVGVPDASVAFNDVYAGAQGRVYVAAGNGRLYRYDASAGRWTPIGVGQTALQAVDVFNEHIYVLADSNTVYWRTLTGERRWHQSELPTGSDLLALALGYPDVAVGKAGTIVKRPPSEPPRPEEPTETPEDPTGVWRPTDPVLPCEVLLQELLTRLTREELVELIERRAECGSELLAQLEAIREEPGAEESVVVLPVVEGGVEVEREARREVRGRRERRRVGAECRCEGHERAAEIDAEAILERICGR
jgi:hypothetical protein